MTNNNNDYQQQLYLDEDRDSRETTSTRMHTCHSASDIDAFEFDAEDLPIEECNVFEMEDTEFALDTPWTVNPNEIVNDDDIYENNEGNKHRPLMYLNSTEEYLNDAESDSLFGDIELENSKYNDLFGLNDVLLQMTNEDGSVANSIAQNDGSTLSTISIEPDLSMYDNINTDKAKVQAHLISNPMEKEIMPKQIFAKGDSNMSVVSRNTSPVIAPIFHSNYAPPSVQPIALPGKNYCNKQTAIKNSKSSNTFNQKTTGVTPPRQLCVTKNNNNLKYRPVPVSSASYVAAKSFVQPTSCVSSSNTRPNQVIPVSGVNECPTIKNKGTAKQTKHSEKSRITPKPLTLSPKPVVKLGNPPSTEESKEARRKRIEIMLHRQRGLYQRRKRQRKLEEQASKNLNANKDKNSILSAQNTFNAMNDVTTSAAVAAAMNVTPSTIPDAEVAKIAFNLIHSMVQLKQSIDDAPKQPKIISRNPKSDKRVPNKKQNPVRSLASNNSTLSKDKSISEGYSAPFRSESIVKNYPINVNTAQATDKNKFTSSKDTTNCAHTIFKTTQQISKSPMMKTVVSCSDLDVQNKKQYVKTNSKHMKKNKTLANKSSDSKKSELLNSVELPSGNDPESRRQRRLIRNRLSAQLHRERKREAMDSLQKEIEDRDGKIFSLEKELAAVSLFLLA